MIISKRAVPRRPAHKPSIVALWLFLLPVAWTVSIVGNTFTKLATRLEIQRVERRTETKLSRCVIPPVDPLLKPKSRKLGATTSRTIDNFRLKPLSPKNGRKFARAPIILKGGSYTSNVLARKQQKEKTKKNDME